MLVITICQGSEYAKDTHFKDSRYLMSLSFEYAKVLYVSEV